MGKDRAVDEAANNRASSLTFPGRGKVFWFQGQGERSGKIRDQSDASQDENGVLPDDHPHVELYWTAVPIWCHGRSPGDPDLDWRYGCGFSDGFERGIITAMLKPEWAQGLYHRLRQYYLTTHTAEDLLDWEKHAEETAQAIPVTMLSMDDQAARSIPRRCDDPLPLPSNCGEPSQ